LFSEFLNSC